MLYAVALHDRYGWPLVGIYDSVFTNIPRHVGVEAPDGHYVDARGRRLTREEFLDGDGEIKPISREEIKRIWGSRDWDHEVDLTKR